MTKNAYPSTIAQRYYQVLMLSTGKTDYDPRPFMNGDELDGIGAVLSACEPGHGFVAAQVVILAYSRNTKPTADQWRAAFMQVWRHNYQDQEEFARDGFTDGVIRAMMIMAPTATTEIINMLGD
jgi:hypothetical protein